MVEVYVLNDVVNGILTYSKDTHPREAVLLLKGKMDVGKRMLVVSQLIIPPQVTHGIGFSSFPLSPLPLDMNILGTMHSHPSGALKPSVTDFNVFYGGLMIICSYPYSGVDCMRVYDAKGREMPFGIRERA